MLRKLEEMTMITVDNDDNILRVFILFIQTAREVLKYADSHLFERARLSVVKLVALQALNSNGGLMTATQIADWTNTERHNISTLVQRMKREGLITVERSDRDKRLAQVQMTDKGRAVLREATPAAWEVVNQVMASFGEEGALSLEKALKVLRQNVHRHVQHIAAGTHVVPRA
jgi:DNA-binding MarR family transcriptional regulator